MNRPTLYSNVEVNGIFTPEIVRLCRRCWLFWDGVIQGLTPSFHPCLMREKLDDIINYVMFLLFKRVYCAMHTAFEYDVNPDICYEQFVTFLRIDSTMAPVV